MKTLVNNLAFRHAYQGFFLLLMIAIPNITLGMTTLYNNQTGLTFTKLESWGVIAINLIIFYLTYLWAKSEGLMTRFRLDLKDANQVKIHLRKRISWRKAAVIIPMATGRIGIVVSVF